MVHEVAINPPPQLTGDEESFSACTRDDLGGVDLVMPSVIQLNPRFRLDPRYVSQEHGDGARDDLDENKTKQV